MMSWKRSKTGWVGRKPSQNSWPKLVIANSGSPAASRRSTSSRLPGRSEEHTSELQSLMRISYAVFCLKKKKIKIKNKCISVHKKHKNKTIDNRMNEPTINHVTHII